MSFSYERPPSLGTPAVWKWYVALCVLLALLNVGLIAAGMFILRSEAMLVREGRLPAGSLREYGLLYIAFGVVFGVANLVLPFLPKRPWTYVLHMANIVAAGLSCLLLPLALPVFVYWLRPEARDLFDFR